MSNFIPSSAEFVGRIKKLDLLQLRHVAQLSGLSYATLWNIRAGISQSPRLETVRKVWPHLSALATTGSECHGVRGL